MLDRGVFYPKTGPGVVWNGLTSVTEAEEGFEETTRYIDGVKANYRRKIGCFSGTIEAFTFPDEFYEDILKQRRAKSFGMSYRSGNLVHLVYNVLLAPSSLSHQQDAVGYFSWEFTTLPVRVPGGLKSSHLVIDTSIAHSASVESLGDILYGSAAEAPRLPLPEEVLDIFEENSILRVIDHGDGTFTVTGPDEAIQMLDSTTFHITWPSAIYIDAVSYTISSL